MIHSFIQTPHALRFNCSLACPNYIMEAFGSRTLWESRVDLTASTPLLLLGVKLDLQESQSIVQTNAPSPYTRKGIGALSSTLVVFESYKVFEYSSVRLPDYERIRSSIGSL